MLPTVNAVNCKCFQPPDLREYKEREHAQHTERPVNSVDVHFHYGNRYVVQHVLIILVKV